MILIAAVDDRMGLTFNRRRQSQDGVLREKVLELADQGKLWMDVYSAGQFKDLPQNVIVNDRWFSLAEDEDYALLERIPDGFSPDDIWTVVLFHWNRHYPSDVKLPIDMSKGWETGYVEEFAGYSHEKITMEVWNRL